MDMDAESTCSLLVTRLGQDTGAWVPRKDAYLWARNMIREIMVQDGVQWEGDLRKVIPTRSTVQGQEFKLILVNVPESLLVQTLLPGIESHNCLVVRINKDMAALQRRGAEIRMKKVQQNRDSISKVSPLVEEIMKLYGQGGSEAKRMKFAEKAMKCVSISAKVAAAKLPENKEDEE